MKKIIGILLLPFLYARYSFLIFIPFLIVLTIMYGEISLFLRLWFVVSFICGAFLSFVLGILGVLKYWTKFLVNVFKIDYKVVGNWTTSSAHSASLWSHPILELRGEKNKKYELSIAVAGGNLYEEEDNIRRKAIVYYLFS